MTVAAVVLAGGQSRRMGANKLLVDFHGKPLIAETVSRILQAELDAIFVVTGYEEALVQKALAGLAVTFVHNPAFADGMATSVVRGVKAAERCDAILICLGDMPLIDPQLIMKMKAAANTGRIVVPVHAGEYGNPVLWGRDYFPQLQGLSGDKGARHLIDANRASVLTVDTNAKAAFLDADTPDALSELRRSSA